MDEEELGRLLETDPSRQYDAGQIWLVRAELGARDAHDYVKLRLRGDPGDYAGRLRDVAERVPQDLADAAKADPQELWRAIASDPRRFALTRD